MASLKDMRVRIAATKATQKITKAMQMVAVSKLRRAQMAAEAARPYAERMDKLLANVAAAVAGLLQAKAIIEAAIARKQAGGDPQVEIMIPLIVTEPELALLEDWVRDVAAQVIAMALISMPVMMRYGYNIRYTTGVLAASGTITQLVPPSLVLIVLADQLGKPVDEMYLGAWGPSVFQIALFALYTFALAIFKPEWVPAAPA